MTLGERLTALRKNRGMSQDALAETLGVSRQSVSKWETDTSVPDLDKLVKLSDLFDISLDELVKGEKSQTKAAAPSGWEKLWVQAVKLYRKKAYLLGWLVVAQGLRRTISFIKGVSIYYNGMKDWDATVQFVQTALSGSLVMIFLLFLTGLLIVFLGRRFSGRFRWYHLGWIPILSALFGLRFIPLIHTGLLECLLMALMLLPIRGADILLKDLPIYFLEGIPLYLLLIFGFIILFVGARNDSAHKEKSSE